MKNFYFVEIYNCQPKEVNNYYKPGWKVEVFDDKNKIPENYFRENETHCFFKYKAKNKEEAIRKFNKDRKIDSARGLLWTYNKEKM